jgi:hypothetical protein
MPHCASYALRISKSKSAADSCVAILTILNWSAVADLSRATIRLTIRAPFPCESASAEAALSDSASVQGLPPRFTQAERPLQGSKSFDWIGHVGTESERARASSTHRVSSRSRVRPSGSLRHCRKLDSRVWLPVDRLSAPPEKDGREGAAGRPATQRMPLPAALSAARQSC